MEDPIIEAVSRFGLSQKAKQTFLKVIEDFEESGALKEMETELQMQ